MNIKKKLLRILLITTGIFVLGFVIVVTYVTINKQKIIGQVTAQLEKSINGKISIGDVGLNFFSNFPSISVLVKNLIVTDSMYANHKHPFLKAGKVYAILSIPKLISKKQPLNGLSVEDGQLYLFTDPNGYSNDYLIKRKDQPAAVTANSNEKVELTIVKLKQFRVVIDDRRREKFHNLFVRKLKVKINNDDDVALSFATNATILVESLAFNTDRGSFLKNTEFTGQFKLGFNTKTKLLRFDSINIELGELPFNLSGKFQLKGTDPQFDLRLHTTQIEYSAIKKLLPAQIDSSLSLVSLVGRIDADAEINGPLKGGDPYIYLKWRTKNAALGTPFMDFDEASFDGYFTDEAVVGLPRKDPNSKIVINNFKAKWHGIPVQSKQIEIMDLSVPILTCDLQSAFPLHDLNELIGSNSLKLTSGNANMSLTYKGPVEKTDYTNSFINGFLKFTDGTVLYAPRDVEMQKVNATLIFKNSDLLIQDFTTTVLGNKVLMQGVGKNLLTLINTGPNEANINWSIYTPTLNLNPFTYLLKQRKQVKSDGKSKASFSKVAAGIDRLLDEGRLNVSLKADQLTYKNFSAQNVNADLSLLQDRYLINNVSMNHADGSMLLKGSLGSKRGLNDANVDVNMQQMDVKKLFRSFNNFGQDGITAESLEGKISATSKASLIINDKGEINPNSLVATIDFTLKKGALNNYEPLKKLQRSVLKNRDFSNIRFAELKNRFEVSNQAVKINRMEIQSSVLTLFVEGLYSTKGKTDLSIQIPLNNLKNRDSDYIPKNIGVNSKVGRSIFIRGRPGPNGDVEFGIDIFNRYNKEKRKER